MFSRVLNKVDPKITVVNDAKKNKKVSQCQILIDNGFLLVKKECEFMILNNGYWLLVIGYWLLVIGYWLLVIGYWLLVIGQLLNCKLIFFH